MPVNDNKKRRRRYTFGDGLVDASLIGGGAGVYGMSNGMSNAFASEGLGRSPKLTPEAIENVSRFANSNSGGSNLDFLYNYIQSGHDASKSRLFRDTEGSVADLAPSMKRLIGKHVLGPAGLDKDGFIGRNILSPLGISIDLHEARDALGEAHYKSFELGPREAYIKMVNEGQFTDTLGNLADSILEARRNFNKPSNLAGRVFRTPEEYFSWKMRGLIGYASAKPLPTEFIDSPVARDGSAFKRLIDKIYGSKEYKYRMAMRDYNRYGGANPVFSALFDKTSGISSYDDLVRALASGRHPSSTPISELSKTSIGDIMSRIVGETNQWEFAPDGRLRMKGAPLEPGFRNMTDLMQNRSVLQEFVDPVLARKFRSMPKAYRTFLNAGKFLTGLAGRGTRVAAGATAAAGLASLLYKLKSRSGGSVKKAQVNDASGLKPSDVLATALGLGSGGASIGYARRFKGRDFNPFARVHASLLGGVKQYDAAARDVMGLSLDLADRAKEIMASGSDSKILGFIRGLEAEGSSNPIIQDQIKQISELGAKVVRGEISAADTALESFLPKRVAAALRMDSFTGQTQATADALRRNGVIVDDVVTRATSAPIGTDRFYNLEDYYRPTQMTEGQLRNPDAFVQVGSRPDENLLKSERANRGAKLYRVNSDFGPGNFEQPDAWLSGDNWMKVKDPKMYDRIATPGLDYFGDRVTPAMRGRKASVNLDNIAVSPVFGRHTFSDQLASHTGKGRVKAMYTFGGGAGSFLGLGDPRAGGAFNWDDNVLTSMLDAIRKKHGNNFDFDFYTGDLLNDIGINVKDPSTGKIIGFELPHNRQYREVAKKLQELTMSDAERAKLGLGPLSEADKALRERYKGLRVVKGVPQSELARAYANSDYVFMVPGSTSAEYASIKDNAKGIRGKLISIIPDEWLEGRLKPGQPNWMPRHYSTNAEYIESLVPGAIRVNLRSPTFSKDLENAVGGAVQSGVFKKQLASGKSWDAFANLLKRDVRLARLGRAGKLGLMAAPVLAAAGYGAHRLLGGKGGSKSKIKIPSVGEKKLDLPKWVAPAAAGTATALGTMALVNYLRRKKRDSDKPRGFNVSTY